MAESDQAQQRKRNKTRSPNFPAIDLGKAIQRARELWSHEHGHSAPFDVVVGHWNYSPKSSSAMQVVAALNAFGLIESEGKGGDREIKLSDRALDIVVCEEGGESDQYWEAVQEAALAPSLHREVWENYGGARGGSDAAFRRYLIRQKGFNPKSADPFIEQYKATISFAKLDSEGKMGEVADDEFGDGSQQSGGESKPQQKGTQMVSSANQPPAGTLPLPVLLDDGSFQVVNIPKMTNKAFKFFKQQLDTYRSAIVTDQSDEADSTNDETTE